MEVLPAFAVPQIKKVSTVMEAGRLLLTYQILLGQTALLPVATVSKDPAGLVAADRLSAADRFVVVAEPVAAK